MEQGFNPLIVIGSAQVHHTYHNPFTTRERREMVEAALAGLRPSNPPDLPNASLSIDIVALDDLFDPPRWAAMALERLPSFAVVFSNDPVTIEAFKGHEVEVRNIPEQQRNQWQGRVIRAQMAVGDPAWREAVPEPVIKIIDQLEAHTRLARLKAEAAAKTEQDNEKEQES